MSDAPRRLRDGGDGSDEQRAIGDLLARVEASEPSGADRARIWAQVEGRTAKRGVQIWWAAGAAACGVALVAVMVVLAKPPQPVAPSPVAVLDDNDGVQRDSGASTAKGSAIEVGERIQTDEKGSARLRLGAGATLALAARSSVRVVDADEVKLDSGSLVADAHKRELTVRVQTHIFLAMGSQFEVRTEGEMIELEVVHGLVRVDGKVPVRTGECWNSSSGLRSCTAGDGETQKERRELTEVSPRKKKAARRGSADSFESLRQQIAGAAGAKRDQLRYELAIALFGARRYRESAAQYESVAESGGAHEEMALYELGRIHHRHLGDSPQARRWLQRYQSRFPGGALRQEVDLTIIETLLSRPRRALAHIDDFLSRYPESERVTEVRLMRGNAMRAVGECENAVADYEQVLQSVERGPLADDALYFAAWCHAQQGRSGRARTLLEAYVARFPDGKHRVAAAQALGKSTK